MKNVRSWVHDMLGVWGLGMWNIGGGCWGCGNVVSSRCMIFGIWDVGDEGSLRCGIVGM